MKTRCPAIFRSALIAAMALLFTPAIASAEGYVLVWGVSAVSEMAEDETESLSSYLTNAVANTTDMEVIGEDEADDGMEIAKDNGACDEDNQACIIEVGRALEVDDAISGELGVVGNTYILTIRRIDVDSGIVIRQVSGQVRGGTGVLIDSMSDMVANLYNIPHESMGTIRKSHHNGRYSYVILTYGDFFQWLEPVPYYNDSPWWWSGPVRHYRPHHRWHGWHNRHPSYHRPAHPGMHRPGLHNRPSRPHRPAGTHYRSGDSHRGAERNAAGAEVDRARANVREERREERREHNRPAHIENRPNRPVDARPRPGHSGTVRPDREDRPAVHRPAPSNPSPSKPKQKNKKDKRGHGRDRD
jgi:hypothetical protein